jgi:hypothetical protein
VIGFTVASGGIQFKSLLGFFKLCYVNSICSFHQTIARMTGQLGLSSVGLNQPRTILAF